MKKMSTKTFVETALLVAITIIMGMTPLGTIRTPFLSVSLVTVPVAIAAIIIGPVGGTICGLTFGITSFINALTGASGMLSTLFVINPFGVFVTAVVTRTLEGFLVAYIFKGFKALKLKNLSYYLASICCPLLNTVLFMSCIVLFFYNTDYIQGLVESVGATNAFMFVILLVGVQGIIEAVTALIIAGTVSLALSKALNRN